MKPINSAVVIAVAISTLSTSCAFAESDAAVRKQLVAGYNTIIAAMKAKDIKPIVAISTPDFTLKEGSHTFTAEQTMAREKKMFAATVPFGKITMTIAKLRVTGGTAVATVDFLSSVTVPVKGKNCTIIDRGQTQDTWVKTTKGWRMKRVVTIKGGRTIDGKPVTGA